MSNSVDIRIPDIEKELEKLGETPKEKQQIKACLFTLIIYAHEPRRIKYLQDLVNTILDKFPCRIIFIKADDKASHDYFHVNVANVSSGQESTMVACDQITIDTSRSQLFRVPYIVVPHIIPDLPVYLLWSQTPFEEQDIFPAIQPFASRVIFDTECSDNLNRFCQEMLLNLEVLKMDIMDINWALLSNWRDVLVQMFDTPQKIDFLKNCKSLNITYNNAKTETLQHPEIRAIYLQGWLASRLKWKYRSVESLDNTKLITYLSPELPIIIALCPQGHPDLPPGAIISLEITSNDGRSYHVARKQSLSQVVVHCSSLEKCELPYSLPLPDVHRGQTFLKEIFFHKLSDHYPEMLRMIANLGRIEACKK